MKRDLVIYDKGTNDVTDELIARLKFEDKFWLNELVAIKQVYVGDSTVQIFLNEVIQTKIIPEENNNPVPEEVQELINDWEKRS